MVLVDRTNLPQIFSTIKAAAAENADTPTVLLIVSHSIDSLASSAILTKLLEDELVSHKVIPVTDYSELSRVYREQIADAAQRRQRKASGSSCAGTAKGDGEVIRLD